MVDEEEAGEPSARLLWDPPGGVAQPPRTDPAGIVTGPGNGAGLGLGGKFCLAILAPLRGLCVKSSDTEQNGALGAGLRHDGGSARMAEPGPPKGESKGLESACL